MKAGNICAAVIAGSLALGFAGARAQTSGISDNTVKIGVLGDMSGVFSDLERGRGSVIAAQMAIDDFVGREQAGLSRLSWSLPIIRISPTSPPTSPGNGTIRRPST